MWSYCLNTSTIRNCGLDLEQEIRLTASVGYQGIELWVSEIESFIKKGGSLSQLRSWIESSGIKVPNLIAFFQWANPDSSVRASALEEAKRIFEMANAIGCEFVAAPPFGVTDRTDIPLSDIASYFSDLISATESTGAKPLLEFWGHSKTLGSLKDCLQVLNMVNDPEAKLLVDIFHMSKTEGSFELFQQLQAGQIGLIHVNDYPYAPDLKQLKDSQRVYPGDGVAPLKQIFDTLRRVNYNGMISLELFNEEYEKSGAEHVARTGLEKMKAL